MEKPSKLAKKQPIVASSAEAKFRAMAHHICKGVRLKRVLKELKIPIARSMKMLCDDRAAINIAKNLVYHDKQSMWAEKVTSSWKN